MKYTYKRLKDRTFSFYCGNRVIARGYISEFVGAIVTSWDSHFHGFCETFGLIDAFIVAAKCAMYACESDSRKDFYFPYEYNP